MSQPVGTAARVRRRSRWLRHAAVVNWRAARLDPAVRGLLWAVLAGLFFSGLNAVLRGLARDVDPFQAQCLRYVMGTVVLLPMVWRTGLAAWVPRSVRGQFGRGQFGRGVVHTAGLSLWFISIPHVTLADLTAIGFTGPIFTMVGAALFLAEPMRPQRWIAALLGLSGVLIVVGPQLSGQGGPWLLVMLASGPFFAASFLITKSQTRYERPEVIVLWQSLTVALLSLPMALLNWQALGAGHWALFLLGGILGSSGHYCLTRAFSLADISATQSVKFLDLVWASVLGWMIFGNIPSRWTVLGGAVIFTATWWIVRHEARGARTARP